MNTLFATIGSGNCFKAHLVMSQLAIPYETVWIDVLAGETRRPDYLSINPNGTVPYLKLEDGRGISESNAMLWYLAKGSPLFPQDTFAEAMAVEWMIVEQTKLEPNISPARFFTTIVPEKRDEVADRIAAWQDAGEAGLARLEAHLAAHAFIAGDTYTIADIAVFGYVHVADEGGFDMNRYPMVRRWCHRVEQTPGFVPMMTILPAAA